VRVHNFTLTRKYIRHSFLLNVSDISCHYSLARLFRKEKAQLHDNYNYSQANTFIDRIIKRRMILILHFTTINFNKGHARAFAWYLEIERFRRSYSKIMNRTGFLISSICVRNQVRHISPYPEIGLHQRGESARAGELEGGGVNSPITNCGETNLGCSKRPLSKVTVILNKQLRDATVSACRYAKDQWNTKRSISLFANHWSNNRASSCE